MTLEHRIVYRYLLMVLDWWQVKKKKTSGEIMSCHFALPQIFCSCDSKTGVFKIEGGKAPFLLMYLPVLRIHDILGWIRIRGSMPLTNGSGSCYYRHWPSRCQQKKKKKNFNTIFPAYYFLKVHLHHFSTIKSQKDSQNSRNQGFSYYFCMMIEGSGSGSIPLTSGSGSGRPKNMWIRIRNAGIYSFFPSFCHAKFISS